MAVLAEYHATLGELIDRFEGTLERFTGDGLMVFFNDPLPCDDPPSGRGDGGRHARPGRRAGRGMEPPGNDLGFGIGIAQGYATLGRIGFEGDRTTRRSAASRTWPHGSARRRPRADPRGAAHLHGPRASPPASPSASSS